MKSRSYRTSQKLGNFESWVEINKKNARIYGCKTEGADFTSGYIEAVTDATFAFYLHDATSRPRYGTQIDFWIDGVEHDCVFTRVEHQCFTFPPTSRHRTITFDSSQVAEDSDWRKLTFKTADLVDDSEAQDQDEETLDCIGSIELVIRRIENVQEVSVSQDDHKIEERDETILEPIRLPEGKMKDRRISHQVIVGEPVKSNERWKFTCDSVDNGDKPFKHFKFFYRSRAVLEDLGFIAKQQVLASPELHVEEATPPNLYLKEESDSEDYQKEVEKEEEEMRELQKRMLELEKKKAERTLARPSSRRVKRERSGEPDWRRSMDVKPSKKAKSLGVVVLDD